MTVDVERAGEQLASRHRRERERFPILPARYEDPAACAELITGVTRYADVIATPGGLLSAVLIENDPSSAVTRFQPLRGAMFVAHGHAVASEADPYAAYHALYAAHGDRLVDLGITDHTVHVPAGDRRVLDAWASLGFGRSHAFAVRDLAPVDARSVDVRIATADELDTVEALSDEESRFHAQSPIFTPYVRELTRGSVRAELASGLAADDRSFLVARVDGEDVGLLSIGPGFGSPVCTPPGAAYIGQTAVVPDARGRGIGAALLARAVAWASEHEHDSLVLHFATANANSSAFWTGQGFETVMVQLRRRLDERITTMRPAPGPG